MPHDDISALNVKFDFMAQELKNARSEIASARAEIADLRSDFDQSKGAVRLIKWTAGIGAAAATVWAAFHGIKP